MLHGHSKSCGRPDFKMFLHLVGLCQDTGTNTALLKGGQSLNKSRSRLEDEWTEHNSMEQRQRSTTDSKYTKSGFKEQPTET